MLDPRGIEHFMVAFAFTQLVEVPLFVRLARVRPAAAFGASLLTHPIVWFAIPLLWTWLYTGAVARGLLAPLEPLAYNAGYGSLAETFAVVVEGAYLRRLGVRRPFLVALAVNATSAAIGTVTHLLTGWP
jgi:hypothetical protein